MCMQVPTPSVFEEASKALSVIIPAYNEEFRLPSTLEETLRCVQAAQTCAHGA